jgi:hypothetical protein
LQLSGHVLDVLPHSQNVATHDLRGILVGHAPSKELCDQVWVLGHIIQPLGRRRDAVEVAAQTDVVVPDQVPNVRDVVGDL